MASASDIPGRYDVVINGEGYVFPDSELERATYGYSPTFVQRQNTQGDYGDNQQEFWLSATQRDWRGGEQQRFFRQDEDRSNRYWRSSAVDVRKDGQVTLHPGVSSVSFTSSMVACHTRDPTARTIVALTSANLLTVDAAGTVTDVGAHGLGTTPVYQAITSDGTDMFFSATTASGVRKWDGSAFSTFSASGGNSLTFLNNTLFGFYDSTLCKWDTAGARSDVFTWKQADGGNRSFGTGQNSAVLTPFGGKVMVLLRDGPHGAELWESDGSTASIKAQFPSNFYGCDTTVQKGVLYISGMFGRANAAGTADTTRPAVYAYTADTFELLWQADDYLADGISGLSGQVMVAIASFDSGVVWNDESTATFKFYEPDAAAVHTLGAYSRGGGKNVAIAAGTQLFLMVQQTATGYRYPGGAVATTGTVTGSLIDFDSSLDKIFRGIIVDYDEGSDGDGGSVDVAYRTNDLGGAYTTLQAGVTSGTEYTLSGVTGRSLSPKITLNKGTSTNGPVLKRVAVRAAPTQRTFKRRTYRLQLSGRNGVGPVVLRDQTPHAKDGQSMATDLAAAATSSSPITIVDRFGSFTAVVDNDGFQIIEIRPEEYVATVRVREV